MSKCFHDWTYPTINRDVKACVVPEYAQPNVLLFTLGGEKHECYFLLS